MKNVIKKIAMLSMLIPMANLNAGDVNACMMSCKGMNGDIYYKSIQNCKRGNFLMEEPVLNEPAYKHTIKVLNIPEDHFIVTGSSTYSHGQANYIPEAPNANGTYVFYTNYYYAAAARNRQSFMNQHKGSDFIGKTTWDVGNNIIS